MSSDRNAPTLSLIAAIEAGAHVLAPSERVARAIKTRYATHALAAGRTAWPTPAVYAFDSFVLQQWRAHAHLEQGKPLRVLNAFQCQIIWQRIVNASRWGTALLDVQAAAQGAWRAWERMQSWCISRDALQNSVLTNANAEAEALLEWSDLFVAQCRANDWLPQALIPERLLACKPQLGEQGIATVAPAELTPLQQRLLAHWQHGGARCSVVAEATAACDVGDVHVAACDSRDHELQSAANWAYAQLQSGCAEIAVVVPDLSNQASAVERVFAERFAQSTRTFAADSGGASGSSNNDRQTLEANFAIAGYRRLSEFPLIRGALDVLRLCSGRADTLLAGGLLRSPYLGGTEREASARALADVHIRRQAREHYDCSTLEHVASALNCTELAAGLSAAHKLMTGTSLRTAPSALAERFVALWRALGWPGDRALDSDEQQLLARLQACLGEFGALDDVQGVATFAHGVSTFERLVHETRFEPRSRPAPVTIVDTQAVAGLNFDAVWIAGVDDSQWPPAAAPDAFIPRDLQIEARMPTATAALARAHAWQRFSQLQTLGRQVVFSWARSDADVELLPSPWLATVPSRNALEARGVETYAARVFAYKPTLEIVAETSAPPLPMAHARGGARLFELQANCPFRAFAELRLDAQALDTNQPSVDARARGMLLHATLSDLWSDLRDSQTLHARSDEELESLVRTLIARHAAKLSEGATAHRVRILQIEQDLATERIMALLELERRRPPFRVFGRPETQERLRVGELTFDLRLDRLDELLADPHRGERVIIDYKTGANVSTQSWTHQRPEQPQLPLYAVTHPDALVAVAFATLGAQRVGYRGVARDGDELPEVKAYSGRQLPAPYDTWAGLQQFWQEVIHRLADEHRRGHAAVDPSPGACRYCHLSTLCRVHEQPATDFDVALEEEGP